MDIFTKEKRSEIMRMVKGKETTPEIVVKKLLFSMGYRFRIHIKSLPGKPDIVFTKRKKAIFVNGCFWHQHQGCKISRIPRTNSEYWKLKFARNKTRDERQTSALENMGWKVLVVWECQLRDLERVKIVLVEFLGEPITKSVRSV